MTTQSSNARLEPPSAPRTKTLLLVDDSDPVRVATRWFLTNFGYAVDTARTAEEALSLFDPHTHDLVISDNSMPGMTGLELAHIIKLRSPTTPILMYTSTAPENTACLDLVILKTGHVLALKDGIDTLLAQTVDADPA